MWVFLHNCFVEVYPFQIKKTNRKTHKSEYPTSESANVSLCIHGVMSGPYFLYYAANETLRRLTSSFLIIPTCDFFMLRLLYVLLITLKGRGLVIFVTVCCFPAGMNIFTLFLQGNMFSSVIQSIAYASDAITKYNYKGKKKIKEKCRKKKINMK